MGILDKKKKLTFEISDYSLKEISDSQLMELEMKVVSEGNNLHEMPITREAIINAAKTIIGKPVLFKFNRSTQDLMGHEVDEIACGVCALTQDDYYLKEIDDKLWLIVKAYIWKMYFEDVVDVFIRDKEKALSMEMFIVDSEELVNDETLITSFCFTGITLIGNNYSPAIPDAEAKVTKYSKLDFTNLVDETKKILFEKNNKNKDTTNIKEKEDTDLDKFEKKEFAKTIGMTAKNMFEIFQSKLNKYTYADYEYEKYWVLDFCNKFVYCRDYENSTYVAIPYTYENKELNVDVENSKMAFMTFVVDENEEETEVVTFSDKERINSIVEKYSAKINVQHKTEKSDLVKQIDSLKDEKKSFESKKNELENAINESSEKIKKFEKDIEDLKTEKDELAKFKESIEKQDRENKINYAIETVKDSLTKEQVEDWKKKIDEFETVEIFTNAIQAFAFTQTKHVATNNDVPRIHIPIKDQEKEKEKKGLWD